MSRIFFTGGTGFIGSHVLQKLRADNVDEIYILTHDISWANKGSDNIHYVVGSIADEEFVYQCMTEIHPEVLLHFAWDVQDTLFAEAEINRHWVVWSEYLAKCFLQCGGKRIIAAGTCFEYKLGQSKPFSADDLCEPGSLYGQCKLHVYRAFDELCGRYGAGFVWGRIFYPYGYGENNRKFITSAIMNLLKGDSFYCHTPMNCIDYIHVDDIANIFYRLYARTDINGAVNIGSGRGVYLQDILNIIEQVTGVFGKIRYNSDKSGCISIISDKELLAKLSYICKEDLYQNIQYMYQQLKDIG